MRREELAFAIDLAAAEGWNPGIDDAECFFAADPGGFLICELAGEPVGCVSAVSYGRRYGFVGLYIVRPEFRGQGHGLRLWHAALHRLAKAGRSVRWPPLDLSSPVASTKRLPLTFRAATRSLSMSRTPIPA